MSVNRMGMMGTVWMNDQIADLVRANQDEIVIRFEDGQEYRFCPAKPIPVEQRSPSENWMESGALTKEQKSKAAWRLAHLQEALTGFASGDPEAASSVTIPAAMMAAAAAAESHSRWPKLRRPTQATTGASIQTRRTSRPIPRAQPLSTSPTKCTPR